MRVLALLLLLQFSSSVFASEPLFVKWTWLSEPGATSAIRAASCAAGGLPYRKNDGM